MNAIMCDNQCVYPSKVVCIGRNYAEHIAELNNETPDEMVFFIKPNSSVSTTLRLSKNAQKCHYEAEISFLIQNQKISAVGFGLDLTLREVQAVLKQKGLPWERAKAFDGSAVFSDFIPFSYQEENLEVQLYINTVLVQKGDVAMMIHKPEAILKEAQTFLSFEENDILMTGTPKGVGEMKKGDIFLGRILSNNKILLEKEFIVE
jgi:2-keto-4-pentenoate hydratase/2-oxohepta-3-ene-1,7-dioic acid hydratase in catechol pathway